MIVAAVLAASFFIYMKCFYKHDPGGQRIEKDFRGEAAECFHKAVTLSKKKKYSEAVTYFEKARDKFFKMREEVEKKHGTLPSNYGWIDVEIRKCNMALKDNREFALRQEQEQSRY